MKLEKKQFDLFEKDQQEHLEEIYPNEEARIINIFTKKGSNDKLVAYRLMYDKLLLINYAQNIEVTEIYFLDYKTDPKPVITLSFRLPNYIEDFIGVGIHYEYNNCKLKELNTIYDKPMALKADEDY